MKRGCALWIFLVLTVSCVLAASLKPLRIYFIDVEGGQSTLLVSPSGQSMLVDTGWPDHNNRDAQRIQAAARDAGIKQIDDLIITHFHEDHVGGAPQLAALIPIRNFVDHGSTVETDPHGEALYNAYLKVRSKGHHILARPGMEIPIAGMKVEILSAAGNVIGQPVLGGGEHNPYCPTESQLRPGVDTSENAQSVGLLITLGKFRMIDLGDLTWRKEYALVCPINRVGRVELYLTTHHGLNISGESYIVDALHPIVAIGNNGANKGGTPEAFTVIHNSPGLEGFWELHDSLAAGKLNAPAAYIANLNTQEDRGHWIKVTAYPNGNFTVTNSRNGKSETYHPRP